MTLILLLNCCLDITEQVILQMATLDKAEALLEDLRSASWDAAVKDLDDIKQFAAKQVGPGTHSEPACISNSVTLVRQSRCWHV